MLHPAHGFREKPMAEGVFVNAIRAVKETLTSRGGKAVVQARGMPLKARWRRREGAERLTGRRGWTAEVRFAHGNEQVTRRPVVEPVAKAPCSAARKSVPNIALIGLITRKRRICPTLWGKQGT